MENRVSFENRDKSKRLLEAIKNSIGHPFDCQLDHSDATAIAGYRYPSPAHLFAAVTPCDA